MSEWPDTGKGPEGPMSGADPRGETAVRALIAEIAVYLGGLPGPGVAEVIAGMNRWAAGPVTLAARSATANPVLQAHLPNALAALGKSHPTLAQAIARAAPWLKWITYDLYGDTIGEQFARGHAYATLIGEGASVPAHDFDLGLFLIAPHVLYRDHCHRAPELYAPLTGPHGWRFAPDLPLQIKPAHEPVWNEPYRPHLTKVGPLPFLALFGWPRDVREAARVLQAQDWAELEALRLG